MGLYLCVFDGTDEDNELEGVEVGSYADFHSFRKTVAECLENGEWGSRFPVVMGHHDCDGVWTAADAATLERELLDIRAGLAQLPPVPFPAGWQAEVSRPQGLRPGSLAACFIDVDGEPLIDRLLQLTRVAQRQSLDIHFQ